MSQAGQVFKQDSGSWACRFYTAAGQRRQIGGLRTKGEARQRLEEELRKVRLGPSHQPDMPLRVLVERFLAQYQAEKHTVAWMRYHLGVVVRAFGDVPIGALDPAAIGEWRMRLPERSAHQTIRVFRQVLEQAVRWRWVESNPVKAVRNPQPRRTEIHPFESWDDVDAVAAELGRLYGPIAIIGAGTGLRPEELFGLDASDVDLDERFLVVRRVFTSSELKDYGKTEASRRRVPLRGRVVDAITQLPAMKRGRGVLLPNTAGNRIDLRNWRQRDWNPAIDAAGIEPHRTPYAMRHTYATWSLAAGVSVFALARRMGTSLDMIDRTYGHLAAGADDHERGLLDAWDAAGGHVEADGAPASDEPPATEGAA